MMEIDIRDSQHSRAPIPDNMTRSLGASSPPNLKQTMMRSKNDDGKLMEMSRHLSKYEGGLDVSASKMVGGVSASKMVGGIPAMMSKRIVDVSRMMSKDDDRRLMDMSRQLSKCEGGVDVSASKCGGGVHVSARQMVGGKSDTMSSRVEHVSKHMSKKI